MANDHKGSPGNLGDLAVSIELPVGDPAYQLQVDPQLGPELTGTNEGRNDGIAK